LGSKELQDWFGKARSCTVFTPQGTEDTFCPEDFGWGVTAGFEGEALVISLVVDLGGGQGGPVPIRVYAKGEWAWVEFDPPPQLLKSRIVVPDVGTMTMLNDNEKGVA